MSDHMRRVLALVAQGKITPAEAEELLKAMRGESPAPSSTAQEKGDRGRRYLKIFVHKIAREGQGAQDVSIRVL